MTDNVDWSGKHCILIIDEVEMLHFQKILLIQNCYVPSDKKSTVKGKNLLPSRPLFRKDLVCVKADRKLQKFHPLYKMVANLPSVCPFPLTHPRCHEMERPIIGVCVWGGGGSVRGLDCITYLISLRFYGINMLFIKSSQHAGYLFPCSP